MSHEGNDKAMKGGRRPSCEFGSIVWRGEEPDIHRELYLRDVTDGMPSPWKLLVDLASQSFQVMIKVAQPGAHTPNCSVTGLRLVH